MSLDITTVLDGRRAQLGLSIEAVCTALKRDSHDVARSTVAGWFSGRNAHSWKPAEFLSLLRILQVDLKELAGAQSASPAEVESSRVTISPVDREVILATLRGYLRGDACIPPGRVRI